MRSRFREDKIDGDRCVMVDDKGGGGGRKHPFMTCSIPVSSSSFPSSSFSSSSSSSEDVGSMVGSEDVAEAWIEGR